MMLVYGLWYLVGTSHEIAMVYDVGLWFMMLVYGLWYLVATSHEIAMVYDVGLWFMILSCY